MSARHSCDSAVRDALEISLGRYLRRELPGFSLLVGADHGGGKSTTVRDAATTASAACEVAELLLVELSAPVFLYALEKAPPETHPDALLRGLAIALFEAVAQHTLDAFRDRLGAGRPLSADHAELVAQLSVELRQAPSLTRLRAFWDEAGLLERGVFDRRDQPHAQGALEVAALWSLIQVHLMATGKLDEELLHDQQASREATLRTERTLEGQKLLNPLMGVGAAGFIGYETLVLHGGILAAVAAVATGVGTTSLLNLAAHRTLKASEQRTVTFKPDTSPRALARLLPALIHQLHDAGLFPVFVVDELDQMADGLALLDRMGAQLRALLTEAAVFLFLVSRGEYQALYARSRTEAQGGLYGRFAERAFLVYEGAALRAWLAAETPDGDPDLVDAALLRGRMCPGPVLRALRTVHAEGAHAAPLHAAEARLQRAIEAQLADPAVIAWAARDEFHRQLVLETLHTVHVAWLAHAAPPRGPEALEHLDGLEPLAAWERALLAEQLEALLAALKTGDDALLTADGEWRLDCLGRPR